MNSSRFARRIVKVTRLFDAMSLQKGVGRFLVYPRFIKPTIATTYKAPVRKPKRKCKPTLQHTGDKSLLVNKQNNKVRELKFASAVCRMKYHQESQSSDGW